MRSYIKTPKSISFNCITENNFTLSSSQYKQLVIKNNNTVLISYFLSRELERKDLGNEVGSINYIGHSTHYFMRTRALQSHSFIPEISSESLVPIVPKVFRNMNLKKGDVIISKDSNIGEAIILERDYPNVMLSGALYRLPINKFKYYLLAFIKHDVFRQQLDFLVPKGATIRHARTLFLGCKIPMPNYDIENTMEYVENLMQAIINKETLIRARHEEILNKIEDELIKTQKCAKFVYEYPRFDEVCEVGRLDTCMYSKYFKEKCFTVYNYLHGYSTIEEIGFKLSRGQNLQISNIGNSIYSNTKYNDFYTLILPKFLSQYGTVNKVEYLGNSNSLKTLKKGDLIFGAEGFEKGRSIVIIEESENAITNIHGITIQQEKHDLIKGIFVKCFLDYLRSKKLIDLIAVGGNGGSLAQRYWRYVPIPLFPKEKQEEIAALYHNQDKHYTPSTCTLKSFLNYDDEYNITAGIYELDKTAKQLKVKLNQAINNIIDDIQVNINFSIM